jgi:zinc protease
MRFRPILAAALIAVAAAHATPAIAAAPASSPAITLSNKMTLVIQENRTRPIVSIQAWIKAGTREETATDRGASAVLSKMLISATRARVNESLDKAFSEYGATYGSEAAYAYSLYQITLPARSFEVGLGLMDSVLFYPRFDPTNLRDGVARATAESRAILADADRASLSPARETIHAGSPLARPLAVPETELNNMNLTLVKRFYDTYYVPSNMMIVIVGDVDPDEVAKQVESMFGSIPAGKTQTPRKFTEKPFDGPKALGVPDPAGTKGAAVTAAFRGPEWGTADALALDVLMAVLVDSPISRAQKRLDAHTAPFTRASSARSFESGGGTVTLSFDTDVDHMQDTESALLSLVEEVRSSTISKDELDAAVSTVERRDLYPLAEMWGLGRANGMARLQGKPGSDLVYFERLHAIQSDDLAGVAAKYLDPSRMVLVEMMPQALADSSGIWKNLQPRIQEKVGISEAAFRKGPKVAASNDRARASRIDGPLAHIPSAPPDPGRGRVERTALPGGIRLVTGEDHSAPLVTIGVYLAGGVRYERDKNNGITSLVRESLLSAEDPAAAGMQYRNSLPLLGKLVPYQDRDMWGVSLSVPASSWRDALSRVGAMFSTAKLDTVTIDASRIVVLTTLDHWLQDDDAQRARLIFPTKYEVSGYRLPGLGTRPNLVSMPVEEILAWYRTFVVRQNVVVAVFGDVKTSDVRTATTDAFQNLSSEPFAPGPIAKEPPFQGFREKWELGGGPVTTVTLAFNGPPANNPAIPTMYVINSLFGGPYGWFNQFLGNQDFVQSTTSVVAQAVDEAPILATVNIMGPVREEEAVKLLFRQFKKAAMLPLNQEDAPLLEYSKTHAASSYLMLLNTNTSRAFQWARAEVFGLPGEYPLTLPAKIDAVVADDLLRVGMTYFEKDAFVKQPYAISETRPGGW